jgi:hypothetical protein
MCVDYFKRLVLLFVGFLVSATVCWIFGSHSNGPEELLSSGIQCLVKSVDVSEQHITSIFRVNE